MATDKALAGFRVLDLTRGLTGPFATRYLADLGADVIKIEPPGGEPGRALGPFKDDAAGPERSGTFFLLNLNKRSVVLDLKSEDGRAAFLRLTASADLVIESLRPGVMAKLGLSYEALRAVNPAIVLLSISNFGQTGPYRDFKGSESVLYGMGAEMYSVGLADREPLKMGGTVALFQAGAAAAVAAVAGLAAARRHGIGQWIDFSIYEAMVSSVDRRTTSIAAFQYSGLLERRQEHSIQFGAGVFPCADGYVELFIEQAKWDRFVAMLGNPAALLEERWRKPEAFSDAAMKEEFDMILLEWLLQRTKREVWLECQAHSTLSGPLYTAADLLAEPVFQEKGFWQQVDHAVLGTVTVPGRPFLMSGSDWAIERPAPLIGEHTAEVLAEAVRERPSAPVAPPADRRPLAGYRVLDFTVSWAGPFAGMLLGDLGAEVIRVENINAWQPHSRGPRARPTREEVAGASAMMAGYPDGEPGDEPWERCPQYVQLYRNKKSVTIDLKTARGREYLRRLVEVSDVVLDNNVPETMAKIGVTWDNIHAWNPRTIFLQAPAFGLDTPYANFRAFGTHIEAMLGHALLRGYADMDPTTSTHVYAGDFQTGNISAFAIIAALLQRERTGAGQRIEVAQSENGILMLLQSFMDYSLNGRLSTTTGNRGIDGEAPSGVYRCAGEDEWLAVDVCTDDEWRSLCRAIRREDLEADPRYATAAARRERMDELDTIVSGWTRANAPKDAMLALQAAGVAAGHVQSARQVLECPHLGERGFFQRIEHRFTGTHDYPGFLFPMPESDLRITPPTGLGEYNEYVYRDLLGLGEDEYRELIETGFAGTAFHASIP